MPEHMLENVSGYILKHAPDRNVFEYVLSHMPDKHVPEHVPGYVSRHIFKRMTHAVLMT